MTTKDKVRELLAQSERCRNDDKFLIWKYVREKDGINMYIPFEDFCRMTSFENITRARREIQWDDGLYLPTDPVIFARRRKEQKFRRRETRWENTS